MREQMCASKQILCNVVFYYCHAYIVLSVYNQGYKHAYVKGRVSNKNVKIDMWCLPLFESTQNYDKAIKLENVLYQW